MDLRLEMEELQESCRILEQKLRVSEDEKEMSSSELHRQLEIKRQKQAELETYIKSLEEQQRRLSSTKVEVCSLSKAIFEVLCLEVNYIYLAGSFVVDRHSLY